MIKKVNQIFLIYKAFQSGAVAKSYMRKGFLIYEEMRKYVRIYEEAVSHIWLCNRSFLNLLIFEENLIFFFLRNIGNARFPSNRQTETVSSCRSPIGLPAAGSGSGSGHPMIRKSRCCMFYVGVTICTGIEWPAHTTIIDYVRFIHLKQLAHFWFKRIGGFPPPSLTD